MGKEIQLEENSLD